MRPLVAFALLCVLACSSSQKIARAAHGVRELASSSQERFGRIGNEARSPDPDLPAIATEADAGQDEQRDIIGMVDQIYLGLTGVRDEIPWWGRLLSWLLLVAAIAGMGFTLWYLRLGPTIGAWIAKAGAWLGARKAPES